MNRPYSEATAAMIAEAMHKALDAVDEGWHLSCMDPDGDGSCAKGHYARRMLVEDVAPAVLDALTKAGLLLPEGVETRASILRRWDEREFIPQSVCEVSMLLHGAAAGGCDYEPEEGAAPCHEDQAYALVGRLIELGWTPSATEPYTVAEAEQA